MKHLLVLLCLCFMLQSHSQKFAFVADSLKAIPPEDFYRNLPNGFDAVFYEDGRTANYLEVVQQMGKGELDPIMFVDSSGTYVTLVAVKAEPLVFENLEPNRSYDFIDKNLRLLPLKELYRKAPPNQFEVFYEDGRPSTTMEVFPQIGSGTLIPRMYVNENFEYVALVVKEKSVALPYESKMADLGELQIEYMDYGGEGPPLIILQDFHNYYNGAYKLPGDHPTITLYKNLSKEFRVLAPLRRGYGKSTDSQWGFDVATLSLDILDFMTAMDIEKAFLYARVPANQELTWIAEYYPERVLGLIYEGNPVITVNCMDSEVLEFADNIQIVVAPDGFDRDKARQVYMSRSMWRPRFLNDKTKRINVPALRFTVSGQEDSTPNLAFGTLKEIQRVITMLPEDREKEIAYLKALTKDSLRHDNLYMKLKKCNLGKEVEEGMQRAFGNNLTTIPEPQDIDLKSTNFIKRYREWQLNQIIEFKKQLGY